MANDSFCQNYPRYKHYDPYLHFCSTTSAVCNGDNPLMGIDMSDPAKPYWYIIGLFDEVHICFSSPQVFTKIIPAMDWIEEILINNS